MRVLRNPRGGKVNAQNNAVRETDADVVAFSDANCTWAPDALRMLVRSLGDPDVAYVCGRLNIQERRRRQQGGPLLALRACAACRRVAPRFGHRRQRVDLRSASRGLRRGRPSLRPRSVVSVPDGAARPARRVRARGACVREGDADERGRVPAQGAHVRALLGDRRRGQDAPAAAAALSRRGRYRTGIFGTRAACCTSCCSPRTIALLGQGAVYAVTLGLQLGVLLAALVGVGIAALLRARLVGDGGGAVELPASWRAVDLGRGGGNAVSRAAARAQVAADLRTRIANAPGRSKTCLQALRARCPEARTRTLAVLRACFVGLEQDEYARAASIARTTPESRSALAVGSRSAAAGRP